MHHCEGAIHNSRQEIRSPIKTKTIVYVHYLIHGPKFWASVFLIIILAPLCFTPAPVWLLGGQLLTMPRSPPRLPPGRVPRGLAGWTVQIEAGSRPTKRARDFAHLGSDNDRAGRLQILRCHRSTQRLNLPRSARSAQRRCAIARKRPAW